MRLYLQVTLLFFISTCVVFGDYCGEGKMPVAFEVGMNGKVKLNCEKPDCMDREFSDCPERAESTVCPGNTTWVGGLDQRVDGSIRLRCCNYPPLQEYGEEVFNNITIQSGNFFEAAVKFVDGTKEKDMEWFDLISDIRQEKKNGADVYVLTIHRFNCSRLPDSPPAWWNEKSWPFWETTTTTTQSSF